MSKLDGTTVYGSFQVNGDTQLRRALNVAGIITGNGSGITSLNGSNIASGTVPATRLPYATSTTKGAIRVEVSGDTLYL
jgi:hypothetical protein